MAVFVVCVHFDAPHYDMHVVWHSKNVLMHVPFLPCSSHTHIYAHTQCLGVSTSDIYMYIFP